MSLNLPSRRIVRSATAVAFSPSTLSFLVLYAPGQRRTLFNWNKDKPKNAPKDLAGEESLKKKPAYRAGGALKSRPKPPARGKLAGTSLFDSLPGARKLGDGVRTPIRDPKTMALVLDPRPEARRMFQKKMIIREIKRRGRLSRTEKLKREERMLLSKSHDFQTSVKKLVPLAKQITGKTLEEAIMQMRFSVKKVAKDVKEHLEHAKNEAMVKRGMGLGVARGDFKPRLIVDKDGKRVKVTDPTTMWIEQAWCGKGLYGKEPDYRARGQIHMMKNRTTSLTVVLREEKTRMRLHQDRIGKEERKPVWQQLPHRPITAQRQYYSW